MQCHKIKKLIPGFLEGALDSKSNQDVLKHLQACEVCAKEKELYEKTWQLMGEWQDIEPEPGFKSRFWNRLVSRKTEIIRTPALNILRLTQRLTVALATAAIVILAMNFVIPKYFQSKNTEILISSLNEEEMVLIENIDLLENLELIEAIEFLEDLDIIENLGEQDLNNA